ncbi:MAG TPA: DUF3000 domain-containing protein [Streptosporangiaceae bacterium]|jgi:hypothetical protein
MRPAAGQAEREDSAAAATFRAAVAALEAGIAAERESRDQLSFDSQPPPRKLAPFAAAVGATVRDGSTEIGWGRFILLYDPDGQPGWGGPLRIIAYIRADLEPEIAADPLVGQVGWSWLTEALDARTDGYGQTSGTVTRVVTEGFGGKQDEPVATEFELRASWSPAGPDPADPGLDGHVAAWCDALCTASGLPSAGVTALRPRRRAR